ncbi:UDP-N-acetylmuramate--L-alanine ligase [Paraconexibacter algicola]|uniref:UDP-N-acetylmuramate--L-alanine ligase n=1 Tax=Paraconexibacter algicola TaxID=2133960 RepID=A0A2T4UD83_9ACTN|nr:UDP-N-acetylmuramate--L-alanine ligase [Paraconexibacter algicola]PTL55467.1 UDP-N-acetylmuramate--L-alanine ligase [Paraconexibacter algicola]
MPASRPDGPWSHRRLHLIGVGGAGMSGYARVCAQLGARVSGSDRAEGPQLPGLRELGVDVHVGHDAANVPAGDDVEVVYSSAVPADNPERAAARERGLRAVPRAELLAELSALRRTLAIAGAHGKTTTTSMAAHVLLAVDGPDPAYLIGGALTTTGLHADWPAGDGWLVVEADESDRSMLRLDVDVAVVTNVELDHHATYGSLQEVREVFRELLDGPPQAVIWDRPDLLELRDPGTPVVPFDATDVTLVPGGSRFAWRGHEVTLAVPGEHNARNAVAALEACRLAGADEAQAVAALATFRGAGRRFDRLGETALGVPVIDDYAHHPTEVRATLEAARSYGSRVVAVFQPHLFSRTQQLHREFGAALALADVAAVVPIYPAREVQEDFPGITGLLIAQAACDARPGMPVHWLPSLADAERVVGALLRPGDLCVVMGAGDVDALGRALVA